MHLELSDTEAIYLYGSLKKRLSELEAIQPTSLSKTDIKLLQRILEKMEACTPQLKKLPL